MPGLRLILHNATPWGSACQALRLGGPARHAGFSLLQGSEWHTGQLAEAYEAQLAGADAVVVQRDFARHFAAYERVVSLAEAHHKPLVYELDDWLLDVPPGNFYFGHFQSARLDMLRALLEADAVTVSTPALAGRVRPFNPNVWVLPNYLDDALWPLAEPAAEPVAGPVVVGYMGGRTHQADLELIAPTLERLLARFGGRIALRFWGSAAPPAPLAGRPNVRWAEVDVAGYAEFARQFSEERWDIGLAPLADNPFNRSKSAVKFLEYSALAVPGVYSRLEPYEQAVVPGENGFLAGPPEEWEARLAQLIEDAELRRRLGPAAQRAVRQGWLMSAHAAQWPETYAAILAAPPAKERRAQTAAVLIRLTQAWQRERDEILAAERNGLAGDLNALREAAHGQKAELAEKSLEIEHLARAFAAAKAAAQAANAEAQAAKAETQAAHIALAETEAALQARNAELAEITRSRGWRLLRWVWSLRRRLSGPRAG